MLQAPSKNKASLAQGFRTDFSGRAGHGVVYRDEITFCKGRQPGNGRIATEPCQLTLGQIAGRLPGDCHGVLQAAFAGEMLPDLAVADGSQAGQVRVEVAEVDGADRVTILGEAS